MKEILAVIRPNMTGATKDALEKAGFPAYTCIRSEAGERNHLILRGHIRKCQTPAASQTSDYIDRAGRRSSESSGNDH